MPQFFLPLDSVSEGQSKTFRLEGPEAFHIVKVLRYKPGQTLTLFDGKGGRFSGVLETIHPDGSITGRIESVLERAQARRSALRLYQGLLKSSHWDYVLEKGTELGVSAFVPVLTPRTVVLLREAERAQAKRERWLRVVTAASKQCQRGELPAVEEPVEFRDAIRACQGQGVTVVAWEGLCGSSSAAGLSEALGRARADSDAALTVNLFIGPEGGFSDEEVELAESLGAAVVGLGPRVLRSETAALAACAVIQHELGQV